MNKLFIAPYNMGSESARDLARSLVCLRVNADKKIYRAHIINWGRSDLVVHGAYNRIINTPQAVALAANKLSTFQTLTRAGVPTVDWTQDTSVVKQWLNEDNLVYARTNTSGSGGQGIIIVGMDDLRLPSARLYTKGFVKTHEYRVHVAFGEVIDYSKKRKRDGVESNPHIKNYDNGWVFCRDGVALPDKVKQASIAAVRALGLDFGAIDILYKEKTNEAKVLEVNTAPGIEGTTLTKYTEAFRKQCPIIPERRAAWGRPRARY